MFEIKRPRLWRVGWTAGRRCSIVERVYLFLVGRLIQTNHNVAAVIAIIHLLPLQVVVGVLDRNLPRQLANRINEVGSTAFLENCSDFKSLSPKLRGFVHMPDVINHFQELWLEQ